MDMLITGASGLLGRNLIDALQARGDRVRALVLPEEDATALEARGVAIYRGDIRQPETLTAPMRDAEGIFHLAGLMGVWRPLPDYHAVNVGGVENVCRAALAAGVRRLVHISSWRVYGNAVGSPCREDFPLRPLRDEPYSITKVAGERMVQRLIVEEGLPAVIIRPGTFFGPGDRVHFDKIADRLRSGLAPMIGSGWNPMPLAYVTDVVQGLLLAMDAERAVGQVYNISSDEVMTQAEFLNAIADEVGARRPLVHVPYYALYAAAVAAERAATITDYRREPVVSRMGVTLFGADNRHAIAKARRELGFSPRVRLREGARLAAAHYLRRPALVAPANVARVA